MKTSVWVREAIDHKKEGVGSDEFIFVPKPFFLPQKMGSSYALKVL